MLLAAAAVLSCKVQPDRWIAPHLAIRTLFDSCRWESRVTQSVQRTPLWPASWLPAIDKGSKSVEVQRVWEVYDERLQFMSRHVVRLGGHQVRKARANVADALDAAGVFLYRDSSSASLLDMRRRFKAVVDVLGAMIRSGISLSRSVELTVQWDRILALGPLYPVTLDDLSMDRDMGIGAFFHAASGVHRRLSDFIHQVVVHRRDEVVREVA